MIVATEAVEWPYLEGLVEHINEKAPMITTHDYNPYALKAAMITNHTHSHICLGATSVASVTSFYSKY